MSYLILSTPSLPYADLISRELWRLVRPFEDETTQFYCGRWKHSDGSVCVGPINGPQPIHKDADELTLASLIGTAVTEEEEDFIIQSIADAKGGSLSILEMIEQIDSLSPNLRTREQLKAEGWFVTEEA